MSRDKAKKTAVEDGAATVAAGPLLMQRKAVTKMVQRNKCCTA